MFGRRSTATRAAVPLESILQMSPATRPTATRECRRPLAEPDQDIYLSAAPSCSNPGPNPHRDRQSTPTNAAKLKPSTIRKALYQRSDQHPPSSMKAEISSQARRHQTLSLEEGRLTCQAMAWQPGAMIPPLLWAGACGSGPRFPTPETSKHACQRSGRNDDRKWIGS
jgi:hypothetical protein